MERVDAKLLLGTCRSCVCQSLRSEEETHCERGSLKDPFVTGIRCCTTVGEAGNNSLEGGSVESEKSLRSTPSEAPALMARLEQQEGSRGQACAAAGVGLHGKFDEKACEE